jgi:hypothetical protein
LIVHQQPQSHRGEDRVSTIGHAARRAGLWPQDHRLARRQGERAQAINSAQAAADRTTDRSMFMALPSAGPYGAEHGIVK